MNAVNTLLHREEEKSSNNILIVGMIKINKIRKQIELEFLECLM